jgi:hypothetical protein
VNEPSETEGPGRHWFGFDRFRLTDGDDAVDVTVGPPGGWDRSHLRRLRQSGDLPGLVPVIDSDFSSGGTPYAVTPVVDDPTLTELLDRDAFDWRSGAGAVEAAARAVHDAHLRGLFHGGLSTDDIHVVDESDVAVAGVGLGLGGTPPAERRPWVAPEVLEGSEPTERSDVFSLGKALEEAVGGAVDDVPRSVRRLIMWSGSDTPEARPPSAGEFASILAEGLGGDRPRFGPALISTGALGGLAAGAGAAVDGGDDPTGDGPEAAAGAAAAGVVAAGIADEVDSTIDLDEEDPAVGLDDSALPGSAEDTAEVPAATVSGAGDDPDAAEAAALAGTGETVEIERAAGDDRRRWAGVGVAVLLLLGLIGVVWNLLQSGDEEPESRASTATTAPAEDGNEDEVADTGDDTDTSDDTGTGGDEDSGLSEARPATTASGPIEADDAGLQLAHGLPGQEVDVYVDGEAVATGFEAGTIAGPIDASPGSHDIEVFAADPAAPGDASTRTDEPLLSAPITVTGSPESAIAHLDGSGEPRLSAFSEPMDALAPGQGRLIIRHVMEAGSLDARAGGESVGSLSPGEEIEVDVPAGTVAVELVADDGTVVGSVDVEVGDGELASLAAIGSADDGSAAILVQRYSGLGTAPAGVPTGDSGLLESADGNDPLRNVYLVMAGLMLCGLVVAVSRRRRYVA